MVGNSTSIKIKLKNVGKHLARDVLILGRIGKTYLGVECESGIAPGDMIDLYTLNKEDLNNKIEIEVTYRDILGREGIITFIKEPDIPIF